MQYNNADIPDNPREIAMHGLLVDMTASIFQVPAEEMGSPNRCQARIALARQVAMYLAHVACGFSFTKTGKMFGRDRTTVSHACGLVEDMRDNPQMDTSLDHMELVISRLSNRMLGEY
jgi:chromosomal replication initiation ATPase DnaA